MKPSKRLLQYAKENYNGVFHTTVNPDGPGVVRIHMIPPAVSEDDIPPSVVIINGMDIIPVNPSWTVLLAEFIKEVNQYAGRAVTEAEVKMMIRNTCRSVRKVFPLVPNRIFREDLQRIMNVFVQVARGEEVDEEIGYMTMGEYAPYMKAPHRMDLMVSAMTKDGAWHCNQKCVHCYAAGQAHSEETELTTGEWKQIIDRCRENGIPQITFTGGEPTMRPDLVELIDHSQWFVTRLNTNGILLTEDLCARLRDASLDSCQITFYSCDEAVHNQLVGAPQYAKTVAGIKNALAAGLNISINTPLCTLNRDYVKTLEFLHGLGVTYVTCSGLIMTGNAKGDASKNLQLSRDELRTVLRDAAQYCFANAMEISFTSPGWIEEAFFEENALTTPSCGACLSNMAVTPGGNVVPCQSWLSGRVLGNLLNDPWEKIWNHPDCVERREYTAKMLGECPLRESQGEAREATKAAKAASSAAAGETPLRERREEDE